MQRIMTLRYYRSSIDISAAISFGMASLRSWKSETRLVVNRFELSSLLTSYWESIVTSF